MITFTLLVTTTAAGETLILTASEDGTYLWSDASITKSISISSSGSYSVTVIDSFGCKGVSPFVTITLVPRVSGLFPNHERMICIDEPIVLATGKTGIHTWSTGETSASVSVKEPGIYWVEVADGICPIVRDSVLILRDASLFVPNLITPNNDGSNDAVFISDYPGKKSIIIYNRWGEKVFEDADYENNFVPYRFQNQILFFTVKTSNQCGDKETVGWIHIVGTP